jgi:hypothetical protein
MATKQIPNLQARVRFLQPVPRRSRKAGLHSPQADPVALGLLVFRLGAYGLERGDVARLPPNVYLGVAQSGQSARFGSVKPQVRILPPRPFIRTKAWEIVTRFGAGRAQVQFLPS